MGGVMIMSEHLLRYHPFAATSRFDMTRVDSETESNYEIKGGDGNDSESDESDEEQAVSHRPQANNSSHADHHIDTGAAGQHQNFTL